MRHLSCCVTSNLSLFHRKGKTNHYPRRIGPGFTPAEAVWTGVKMYSRCWRQKDATDRPPPIGLELVATQNGEG